MLTPTDEDRIEDLLVPDDPVTVEYDGAEHTTTLSSYWSGGDDTSVHDEGGASYPVVVFEWDSRDAPNETRQPVDNVREVDVVSKDGDEYYRKTETTALEGELTLQVVDETGWKNGIPASVRLYELARPVWGRTTADLVNDSALNETDAPDETPIVADLLSGVTSQRDVRTVRVQWAVELQYDSRYQRDAPVVEDIETETDVE